MKPSVIRFNLCSLFLALSLFLLFVPLALSGCGGGSTSGTKIRTFVAGSNIFGNAIDSSGNVWMANGGQPLGIPGKDPRASNVMELSPAGTVIGTYIVGSIPIGIAIDKSGNVWVENMGISGIAGLGLTDSNVTELNPSGTKITTCVAGKFPAGGIAIDKSGNVWVTNWGAPPEVPGIPGTSLTESNVSELSPSGTLIGTYVAGSSPGGIAIDSSGNVWVANKGNGTPGLGLTDSNVTELNPSGTKITTCVAGSKPEGIAIDPSGNVWTVNKGNGTPGTDPMDSSVTEIIVSSGTVIRTNTYVAGSLPEIVAIDAAGNVWVSNGYGVGGSPTNSTIMVLNPSGKRIHTYATGNGPYGIAIDPSGNVWVTNYGNGTAGLGMTDSNVQEYMGAAKGPQYFPYSGPQWPGAE